MKEQCLFEIIGINTKAYVVASSIEKAIELYRDWRNKKGYDLTITTIMSLGQTRLPDYLRDNLSNLLIEK